MHTSRGQCPQDAVSVPVQLPGTEWHLFLNETHGWVPAWEDGLVALVILATFILAGVALICVDCAWVEIILAGER